MKSRSISIQFDDKTYKLAERMAKRSRKSIPEMIKDMIKTKGDAVDYRISKNVKRITGILKTDKDYKELRDMIMDEKIEKYENLR